MRRAMLLAACCVASIACVWAQDSGRQTDDATSVREAAADLSAAIAAEAHPLFGKHFPMPVVLGVAALLCCSAFFSGSETAFFSINKLRLRSLKEEGSATGALIAQTMEHPGRLLTTILIGNMIVNTLTGIVLGSRAEQFVAEFAQGLHPAASYAIAATLVTLLLVF
ncbi:MAG: DUF21 domain-containing protein, partial [Candidatus Hydrogenedentes bacterium]|nr:DUF21 domain-containing protein [Candidatus Hydrogenedentota bacterium]